MSKAALVLSFAIGLSVVSHADPEYTLTTLPTGHSAGVAINSSGTVAGVRWVPSSPGWGWQAYSYQGGIATDLGNLGGEQSIATDIDDSGLVVGYAFLPGNTVFHAFTSSGGPMVDINPLGALWSQVNAMNNVGQLVGESTFGATMWMGGVPSLIAGFSGSPMDINDAGQIAGRTGSTAFRFQGGVGTVVTNSLVSHEPLRINASGVMAGSISVGGLSHAFFGTPGNVVDIGTLTGRDQSRAFYIGDDGTVIGGSWTVGMDEHAFIYKNGVMRDLNDLISQVPPTVLGNARGMNSAGQIVGAGNGSFLLTPVPEPATMACLGLGVLAVLRRRRKA